MNTKRTLDTIANTSSSLSSLISGTFKVKLFVIVGFTAFFLGLGLGLTGGLYWGYKKWVKKVDKLIEVSKHEAFDKIKNRVNTYYNKHN